MNIDLDDARWTQRQLHSAGVADIKAIDNYIQHGHATPKRVQGRRLFSARHAIEIGIMARLAARFGIPPHNGAVIAAHIVQKSLPWLQQDAKLGLRSGYFETWIKRSAERVQVACVHDTAGALSLSDKPHPDSIDIVIPAQIIARQILVGLFKSAQED